MKTWCFLIVVLVAVVGAGAKFGFLAETPAPAKAPANPYTYTPDRVIANGVTEGAGPEVDLRPEVAGRIVRIPARENDTVAAGDVLVELADETQQAQLDMAEAELARARANLDKVRNGARPEQREAVAALEEARRVLYQQAKADYQRAQRLAGGNAISRGDFDSYHFAQLRAEAEWKQAKAELDLIEAPARAEDVALAEAEIAAAQAKLNQARAELAKTRLLAPSRGRVLRVYAEPGELATPAATEPALLFADLSQRRVRAFVEELDSGRVTAGQTAKVTADALPGKAYAGKVVRVYPRMDKQAPRSDAPGEYSDVYYREVLIELDTAEDIPLNLRVEVEIQVDSVAASEFTEGAVTTSVTR